jgi:hypothetical protein
MSPLLWGYPTDQTHRNRPHPDENFWRGVRNGLLISVPLWLVIWTVLTWAMGAR